MIRHIVLFKIKDFSSEEERKEAIDNVIINFRSLIGEIPQIREYNVAADMVHTGSSYDVVINSTFDSVEDLKAYQAHPAHKFAVEQNKQWSQNKVVIDYEL
jgi:hypothetical protein